MTTPTDAELEHMTAITQAYVDALHDFAEREATAAGIPPGVAIRAVLGWAITVAASAGITLTRLNLEADIGLEIDGPDDVTHH